MSCRKPAMATMLSSSAPASAHPRPKLIAHLRTAAGAARARREPVPAEAREQARQALAAGAPEALVRAAGLASAWELPEAPRLADVPDELWGPYAEWLLAAPASPAPETAAAVARHLARRCAELADWMDRNLASPAVRAAADAYLGSPPPSLDVFPAEEILPLQQARARILQRAQGRPAAPAATPRPRAGRPLRVGVLHDRFDHRPACFATLARCAQLDPERVELHFFALQLSGSALEERCREFAACFHVLPHGLASQFHELKALDLDCLVFADELSGHRFPMAQLALLRAAPLQIATGPHTTALGGVDLLLSGELDAPATRPRAFAERLALLTGSAQAWDLSPDRPAESIAWTRAVLGLAEDRPLVVATAPAVPASADLARWRTLLNSSPETTLLLVPSPGLEDLSEIRAAVFASGESRLVLHEPAPFDHAALASLLGLADLALGLDGPAAALALEAGVPLLALAAEAASAPLRGSGLEELVFADEPARLSAAARLLGDAAARVELRGRVLAVAESLPRVADTYALASDFVALLEHAWDRLCAEGHGRFRRQREPLRVATPHSLHPGDLHAEALALLSSGRPGRAAPCLLSAIQRAGADAALWFDLARAYRATGQMPPAIESLEASLRLDEGNAAAWRLLCELAAEAGNLDLAREALDVAAALAAEHPDLAGLRARVAV